MSLPVQVSSLVTEAELNPMAIKPSHTKEFIPKSVAFFRGVQRERGENSLTIYRITNHSSWKPGLQSGNKEINELLYTRPNPFSLKSLHKRKFPSSSPFPPNMLGSSHRLEKGLGHFQNCQVSQFAIFVILAKLRSGLYESFMFLQLHILTNNLRIIVLSSLS